IAAGAVPDPVLVVVVLEPLDRGLVARVADEAESLRERRGSEELGVRLHRIALGDAAAAHDAERLLVDRVHLLLGDDPLLLEHLELVIAQLAVAALGVVAPDLEGDIHQLLDPVVAAVKSLTSAAGGTGAITGVPKSKSSTDSSTSTLCPCSSSFSV